jgi:hypothetical protein
VLWFVVLYFFIPVLRQAEIPTQVLFSSFLLPGKSEWSIVSGDSPGKEGMCLGTVFIDIPHESGLNFHGTLSASSGEKRFPIEFSGDISFTVYRWAERLNLRAKYSAREIEITGDGLDPKTVTVRTTEDGNSRTFKVERPQPILLVPKGASGYAINLIPQAQRAFERIIPKEALHSLPELQLKRGTAGCSPPTSQGGEGIEIGQLLTALERRYDSH